MVVPAGSTVLYDQASSPIYAHVEVRGRLVFDDTTDLALDAEQITVFSDGEFVIGSCDCHFTHKAIITLHTSTTVLKSSDDNGVGIKSVRFLRHILLSHL